MFVKAAEGFVILLAGGLVGAQDVRLLTVTDDPDEAVRVVVECYERNCAT